MKTLLLFVTLFALQFAAQSQEYLGLKFKVLDNKLIENPDKRYNLDSCVYRSTGCDSLRFRFFYSTFEESRTYGTAVFYNVHKDSVITIQRFLYKVKHMDYVHQEFIRLSNKGYKVKYDKFDEVGCSLEIRR